jgi:hypothetical protein
VVSVVFGEVPEDAVVAVVRSVCLPSSGLAHFGARPLHIQTVGGMLSYAMAHWP